jgi:hypothetical protein
MRSHTQPTRVDVVAVAAGTAPRQKTPALSSRADDIDIVEVWGQDSFPASDPPANW